MHNINTPIRHLVGASLVLALGTSLVACKGSPSQTRAPTTDYSVVTPPTSGTQGAPVVDAGTRQLADANVTVFLGGRTTMADGASLASARWTQLAGPAVTLLSPDSLDTRFVSPLVDTTTQLVFQLAVTDDQGRTGTDTVRITISPLASTLQLSGGTVAESAGEFRFAINLPQPPAAPLVLRYATRDGSALAGQDYEALNGELTVPAGASTASIPALRVFNDTLVEGNETLSLVVTATINGENVQATASATILDDDVEVTPPVDISAGDVVEAVLERQSFIAQISDSNTNFAKESLTGLHPILNRSRTTTIECETGEYSRSLDAGALPRVDRPVVESTVDCQMNGYVYNGEGEFALTSVSENFYDAEPQAVNFQFNFAVNWNLDILATGQSFSRTESGWARYENYDFDTQTGFREVNLERLTSTTNDVETVHFDFAEFSVWQRGLFSPATQISGLFDTRVTNGTLAGRSMRVELLSQNDYNFGEDGVISIDDQLEFNGQSFLLPYSGRVLYAMSLEGEATARIVANYFDFGATLHMDLNGNGCVDATGDLAYQRDQNIPAIGLLIANVSEEVCQPLPTEAVDSPSSIDIVDGVDGNFPPDQAI